MGFNHNLIKILSFIPCLEVKISKFALAIKISNDVKETIPLMWLAFLILFKLIHSHGYLVLRSFSLRGTLCSTGPHVMLG